MSLKVRRILYIFFILLFLTITPIVILYAAGYKLNSNFDFQKTGILIIDTEPKGAKIYINGKPQQKFFNKMFSVDKKHYTTPIKLKNILPGEYDIKLELKNYWSWEKKLTIRSGESTFIEDISLFKINPPLLLADGEIDYEVESPNKKYIIAGGKNFINLISTENDNFESYTSTSTINFQNISITPKWSENSRYVLIGKYIFDIENWHKPLSLDKKIGSTITNLKWNTSFDNKLYYTNINSINYYNLSSNISRNIINNQKFSDYIIKDNYLHFINNTKKSTKLSILNIDNNSFIKEINLPLSDYNFINHKHNFINLHDKKHDILYLIDPLTAIKPIRETINNITKTIWINETKLIFTNDFEIWIYDDNNNKNKILLTRISDKIESITWHPSNNYVIYSTNNAINIIELDDRNKYNIIKLIKLDIIKYPILNKEGDALYFYSEIGSKKGIYKLLIQ